MRAPTESERPAPQSPAATKPVQPSSPRLFHSLSSAAGSPGGGAHRRIAIAVDLSDESAYAVKWAVQNYLRPGDAVILLHVRPTSVLYGADWGSIDLSVSAAATAAAGDGSEDSQQKLEDDFDTFTTTKVQDLAQPLVEAQIPFRIHIVKDHDMKERLCLEIERLGPSAVIMGSRGFGAARRASRGRLGSVSDYCVHHCVCPVVVVRYPDDKDGGAAPAAGAEAAQKEGVVELHEVPEEEEQEHHDASDEKKGVDLNGSMEEFSQLMEFGSFMDLLNCGDAAKATKAVEVAGVQTAAPRDSTIVPPTLPLGHSPHAATGEDNVSDPSAAGQAVKDGIQQSDGAAPRGEISQGLLEGRRSPGYSALPTDPQLTGSPSLEPTTEILETGESPCAARPTLVSELAESSRVPDTESIPPSITKGDDVVETGVPGAESLPPRITEGGDVGETGSRATDAPPDGPALAPMSIPSPAIGEEHTFTAIRAHETVSEI